MLNPAAKSAETAARDFTPSEMLRRPSFWMAFLFLTFLAATGSSVISFAKDLALAVGSPESLAVTLVGILSVCNGLGRIFTGALFDALGRRLTMIASNVITITAAGVTLIAVVLGADSGTARFKDAATLLDFGFVGFETVELSLNDELYPVAVEGGMEKEVGVVCADKASLTLPKGEGKKLKRSVTMEESVPAPVMKGDKLGTVSYTLNGDELASFDILAASDVEKKSFSSVFALLWRAFIGL